MPSISTTEFKAKYTTKIAAIYDELMKINPTGFLRSKFPDNVTNVRYPAIDIRRGSEKVAIDVIRGHQGNRTEITKASQKILDTFYIKQYIDVMDNDLYWNLFGSTSISENIATEIINGTAVHFKTMTDMCDRAIELWCAQVLEFGTCTSFNDGSVINFGRKADMIVDLGAGNYWTTTGTDPYKDIGDLCMKIRKYGKYTGGIFDVIMGEEIWNDFMTNSTVKERNDIKMWQMDQLVRPEARLEGQNYHGTITCGSFNCHIWTYPQFYEDPITSVLTPYVNPKKCFILPPNPNFQTIFSAVPVLVPYGTATPSIPAQKYLKQEIIDPNLEFWKFQVKTAPLPVPIAIDTFATLQGVAA